MTTEAQFLAEAQRRGYRREQMFLLPGPDERRNPEGGVVVEAPGSGPGASWRTYRMDRGVRDEAAFDNASDAYDHVLATVFAGGARPALDRAGFEAEVTRRGGKTQWFVFRRPGEHGEVPNGRTVFEGPADDGGWVVFVADRGERDRRTFASESAALEYVLESSLPRR